MSENNSNEGKVEPRRPTARAKHPTAMLPGASRPHDDSWAMPPAPVPATLDGEATGLDELLEDPPRGATLRTGSHTFVDMLEPAPAEPSVNVAALVEQLAESDPVTAEEIRADYADDEESDDGEPADDLIVAEKGDDGFAHVDDQFAKLMGEVDEITTTGEELVLDPFAGIPPTGKEEEMTTENRVDPHAATTATPALPVPAPAEEVKAVPADTAAAEVPTPDAPDPQPDDQPKDAPQPDAPAAAPEKESAPAKPAAADDPAEAAAPVPKPEPLAPAPAPKPAVSAKDSAPRASAPSAPLKGPALPKPVVPPLPVPVKDKTSAKHPQNATTAAIPPKPAKKASGAFKAMVVVLLLAVLGFVGWQFYCFSMDVGLGKYAAAQKHEVPKTAIKPADIKPAVTATPAPPAAVAQDDVAVATMMAVDERLKMALPQAPADGYTAVDEKSPIAKFVEGSATPKSVADCLPKTTVVLQELDVIRCCAILPTSRLRTTCVMYSNIQVLNTEDAL